MSRNFKERALVAEPLEELLAGYRTRVRPVLELQRAGRPLAGSRFKSEGMEAKHRRRPVAARAGDVFGALLVAARAGEVVPGANRRLGPLGGLKMALPAGGQDFPDRGRRDRGPTR